MAASESLGQYKALTLDLSSQEDVCGNSPCSPTSEVTESHLLSELVETREMKKLLETHLAEIENVFSLRKTPVLRELENVSIIENRLLTDIELLRGAVSGEPPPGPKWLRWVEGDLFTSVCMLVILINFAVMILEKMDDTRDDEYWMLDQVFMGWYVIELSLKAVLHQKTLLCGTMSQERCFHWLDLLIVSSGVVDQWVMPALKKSGLAARHHESFLFNPSGLRALRILRVGRMLRLLKALKLLLAKDVSWADGRRFESFITVVILLNALTMGLELDMPGPMWKWINVGFLAIYTFELFMKLKKYKWEYFTNEATLFWHWMDFIIVLSGLIEMLGVPAYNACVAMIGWTDASSPNSGVLSMIRILRLLRVLRLYRLLTFCKSLRKLVLGVADAMHGTLWVIVLTFVVIYIFAIIFTTLVGQGIVFGDDMPDEAKEHFGKVEQSAYMLFKLMNDDQSVVMFTESVWVKMLFVTAMVVLNWVMLATLTSVVTDHMNSSTGRAEKTEDLLNEQALCRQRNLRLMALFQELDGDGNGLVDRGEFEHMLMQPNLRRELMEASGMLGTDLAELFQYLSHEVDDGRRVINYEEFIHKLGKQANPVNERGIYRLEAEIRACEARNAQRFNNIMKLLESPLEARSELGQRMLVPCPKPQRADWVGLAERVEKQEAADNLVRKKFEISKRNSLISTAFDGSSFGGDRSERGSVSP